MNKVNLSNFETLDQWIRQGQVAKVRTQLRLIEFKHIPRADTVKVANLFRRVGWPEGAVKCFYTLTRDEHHRKQMSHSELAEYGAALTDIGVYNEGFKHLQLALSKGDTKAYLYLALWYIRNWDYKSAIPYLSKYINVAEDPYQVTVAQVNLAAALISTENHVKADSLLNSLEQKTQQSSSRRLLGNIYELKAQNAFSQNDIPLAELQIQKSEDLLIGDKGVNALLVHKWRAVFLLHKFGPSKKAELQRVRKLAEAQNIWEITRDCDLFLAKYTHDNELFNHIYYGSPFLSYRERILAQNPKFTIFDEYQLGKNNSVTQNAVLDLNEAQIQGTDYKIKPGQIEHRLLRILCSDFYKPFRIGGIANSLYPDEKFDPFSSTQKTYKSIRRLRAWFSECGFPATVSHYKGLYSLKLTDPSGYIRIAKATWQIKGFEAKSVSFLSELSRDWHQREFLAKDLSTKLGVSQRTINRMLKEEISKGKVKRIGGGRSTRFKLVS